MTHRFATLTSRLAISFAFLFAVTACGGGGGGGNDTGFIPDDGDSVTYKITLSITDSAGNPTSPPNTVTATAPVVLTAKVVRNGKAAEGVVAAAVADIGVILPASGTALTDADGEATFQIAAGDELGAGTIEVSVEDPKGGAPSTATINFQVGQAGLRLGDFEDGIFIDGVIGTQATNVSAGGSALLQFSVVDENDELASTVETIQLKSGCVLSGQAQLPNSVDTVNGQATATYTATGCSGDDEITATLASNGATATTVLTVAEADDDQIAFQEIQPESRIIALKGTGTGNRPETATVTFKVEPGGSPEEEGPGIGGVPVDFKISTDVGGIALQNDSGITDSDGMVKAVVTSGNIATSVTVTATIRKENGPGNSTASPPIVVSTGLPDQNSISISASTLNVKGALNYDGRTAEITVRLADKFNNPVADGTSAVFTTEYGSIEPSCVTTNGGCTVTWTSQDPRFPVFNQDLVQNIYSNTYDCDSNNAELGPCPDDLGTIRGLRTTILVTVVGEEYFVDSNGNGLYDKNEPFENLPEAFVDHNEDGVYTPVEGPQCPTPPGTDETCEAAGAEETFIDFDGDGEYSLNVDPVTGKGVYNGSLCPLEGEERGWCSRELVNVRDDIVLIMSDDSEFYYTLVNARTDRVVSSISGGDRFEVYIADFYNNSPAPEVEIKVDAEGECAGKLLTDLEPDIPDTNRPGAFTLPIRVENVVKTGEGASCDGGRITVTAGATSRTWACNNCSIDEGLEASPGD